APGHGPAGGLVAVSCYPAGRDEDRRRKLVASKNRPCLACEVGVTVVECEHHRPLRQGSTGAKCVAQVGECEPGETVIHQKSELLLEGTGCDGRASAQSGA